MPDFFTAIRICDCETTGLEQPAELVEIGWTDVRFFPGEGWAIESKAPSGLLVNPGMDISFGAMGAHHITPDMVKDAVSPDYARNLLNQGTEYFCAHNAQFDQPFVKSAHTVKWICTFKCAKHLWPTLESYSNNAVRYARGLCMDEKNAAMCMPSHRAGPDTWVTAHILLDMLKVATIETLVEISSNPFTLLRMPFGKHKDVAFRELPFDYLEWILNKSDMPKEPGKEDLVYTTRLELARRAAAEAVQP